MSPSLTFAPVRLPTGESAWIPSDVELKFPDRASIEISRLHCLAYIPWRDTYLQRNLIYTAILYHDKPEELAWQGGLSAEVKLVCDVDHLWSFTHENFWQDTVRKGVAPAAYVKNLEADLDDYFVTEPGRQQASRLLEARRVEVTLWEVSSAKTAS